MEYDYTVSPCVACSASVQGMSHKRLGIEREDRAAHLVSESPSYIVAAVADGHGDPTCVRSARGAQMAVDVALGRLQGFAESTMSLAERCTVHEAIESNGTELVLQRLTSAIVREWTRRANEDYAREALSETELARFGLGSAWADAHVEHLYGSTLVAALLMPGCLLLVQMGDGACAVVYEDGSIEDPLPPDPLCVGNVTTSLSDRDAAREIRYALVDVEERPFVACYVTTDGVDKSLAGEGGMRDFCAQLTCDLQDHLSDAALGPHLTRVIDDLARGGSQDDASIAIIVEPSAIAEAREELVRRHEVYRMQQKLQWAKDRLASMRRKRAYLLAQPVSAGGEAGDRERCLVEYDELELYVRELEGKLGALTQVPVAEASPSATSAGEGLGEISEEALAAAELPTASHGPEATCQDGEERATEAVDTLRGAALPDGLAASRADPFFGPFGDELPAQGGIASDEPAMETEELDDTAFLFAGATTDLGQARRRAPFLPIKVVVAIVLMAILGVLALFLLSRAPRKMAGEGKAAVQTVAIAGFRGVERALPEPL